MSDHARLSPSSSDRWLVCAGSVAANRGKGDDGNDYAREGTAAHALLEMALRFEGRAEEFTGPHLWDEGEPEGYDYDNMVSAVNDALDWIWSYKLKHPNAIVKCERKVNPGAMIDRDDCWGTLDVSIESNDEDDELVVADYKHGAGVVVEAIGNPQIKLYALGAIHEHGKKYKRYRFAVVQPRARHDDGPIREHVVSHKDLMGFAAHAARRAAMTDRKDAERTPGDHCRWCKAKSTCRTLAEANLSVAASEFTNLDDLKQEVDMKDSKELTPKQIGFILLHQERITTWLTAVATEALARARAGKKIPGFKLVKGRQGNRTWKASIGDAKLIKLLVKAPLTIDDIAPRSPLSVAQAEKAYKKIKKLPVFQTIEAKYTERGEGGIHLAPISDPRPEHNSAQLDFADKVLE